MYNVLTLLRLMHRNPPLCEQQKLHKTVVDINCSCPVLDNEKAIQMVPCIHKVEEMGEMPSSTIYEV